MLNKWKQKSEMARRCIYSYNQILYKRHSACGRPPIQYLLQLGLEQVAKLQSLSVI